MKNVAPAPPCSSGISIPMIPSSKQASISSRGILRLLVHLPDERPDPLLRELRGPGAEHLARPRRESVSGRLR